ncbi:MerR family transcriptional regulator [Hankyongella ginsenosidimutans]|nr:MerR family transcriptional regulator [Hankyongella ginsenosidimutans]
MKSPEAYKTISEVSELIGVPQHVLRFWETKFAGIRPLKRGGNRRYYRPEDLRLLRIVNHLLYTEGYTIRGVQKLLREKGAGSVLSGLDGAAPEEALDAPPSTPDAAAVPDLVAPQPPEQGEPTVALASLTLDAPAIARLQALRQELARVLAA